MRKLFSFLAISADGYHASTDDTVAWQTFGPEFVDYSVEQLDEVDTLVFGRTTYESLVGYWTSDLGPGFDPQVADRMNRLRKLVVSRSLASATWGDSPTSVVDVEGLAAAKRESGLDLAILGSSTLTAELLAAGLVDELRLLVNPVLLGGGKKLFESVGTTPLGLTRVRPFESGNVLLYYHPATA